jgi:hypothetical protein
MKPFLGKSKPSEFLQAMVDGLWEASRRRGQGVDMSTYGMVSDEDICYGRALVDLTHGEIRFLMWALPQADLWTSEGMKAWADMGNRDRLITKLWKCLPEAKDKTGDSDA